MPYQITDEQIDDATKDIGLQSPFARYRIARAVLALAAPQGEPYGWAVTGCHSLYRGEWAESTAQAEAKRCGGTAVAFPLYTAPAPAPAPAVPSDALSLPKYRAWLHVKEHGEWPKGIDRAWMKDDMGRHNDSVVAREVIQELAAALTAAPEAHDLSHTEQFKCEFSKALRSDLEASGYFEKEAFGFFQERVMQYGGDFIDDDATIAISAKDLAVFVKAHGGSLL